MKRAILLACALATAASADTIIDNGQFGANIGPIGGTGSNIYGQSFTVGEDTMLVEYGMWLAGGGDTPALVRLDIWADDGSNHPDETNIIVEGTEHQANLAELTRVDTTTSVELEAGVRYWVVINGLLDLQNTPYSSTWDGQDDTIPGERMDWSNDQGATWSGGIGPGDFGVYVRLTSGGDCPADCNGDGELNILDFVCFQSEWQSQSDLGDCDGNGEYNILDFVCFQGEFQQGCP